MTQDRTSFSLLLGLRDYRNEKAWHRFMHEYGPAIMAWARRWGLSSDDADEVAGMVLLKLAKRMDHFEYDPDTRFRTWLRTVVDSQVKDFFTQRSRRPQARGGTDAAGDLLGELEDHREAAGALENELESLLDPQVVEAMEAVRNRVEPHTWQAFWTTVGEGLKGTEAARRLGLPVATVHQARSRVARLVREEVARRLAPDHAGE